ncbi:hypothetical protein BH09PLA1_BH09PLA1_18170 [soil metagenome]
MEVEGSVRLCEMELTGKTVIESLAAVKRHEAVGCLTRFA